MRKMNFWGRMTLVASLLAVFSCTGTKAGDIDSIDVRAALTREQSDEAIEAAVAKWKDARKHDASLRFKKGEFTVGEDKMPVWYKIYGEKPSGGRSLYISMHGGGNTTSDVNDSQWDNQKKLYTPSEGVYVAPRAPWNDWNMWFQDPIDDLFSLLVADAVACLDVNPDRVYLMGYSAGGDGVWRMGPRMADSWAAASMMAGHPGDVKLLSLRNTPFMIWCGANDSAYDRNAECERKGKVMDSLAAADPGAYIHETHIVEGKGHWMSRLDTAAVPWMAAHTRNPHPSKVVWCQGDRVRRYFYWVGLGEKAFAAAKKFDTFRAEISGNTITITECPASIDELELYLADDMMDLDSEVKVVYGDRLLFSGKVERTKYSIENTLSTRNDPSYAFPVTITVKMK